MQIERSVVCFAAAEAWRLLSDGVFSLPDAAGCIANAASNRLIIHSISNAVIANNALELVIISVNLCFICREFAGGVGMVALIIELTAGCFWVLCRDFARYLLSEE